MGSHYGPESIRQQLDKRPGNGSAIPASVTDDRHIVIGKESNTHEPIEDSMPASGSSRRMPEALILQQPPNAHYGLYERRAVANLPSSSHGKSLPCLDNRRIYKQADLEAGISSSGNSSPIRRSGSLSVNGGNAYPAVNPPDLATLSVLSVAPKDGLVIDGKSYSSQDAEKMSAKAVAVSGGSSRLPDFFGPGVFQVVLHNPTIAYQLLKFSQARFCSENVEFLEKVEQYHKILNNLTNTMAEIHRDYISPEAPKQVNLPGELIEKVQVGMRTIVESTLPAMESIFLEVQEKIEQLVYTDVYPRFVRFQMTLSATRALANDRDRYQGLGDCFCLTNPSQADNPIAFASDGFVKVTGYSRAEVIPRNCRFLQGADTDMVPILRLKQCIQERKESVELILNYKKDGQPFWNLLYVAPLYDAQGALAYFIGGQVNCSTTVNSPADVMRILSTSADVESAKTETPQPNPGQSKKTRKKGLFKRLRSKSATIPPPPWDTGMEEGLLHRLEGNDLQDQMKEFYTAYSKFIVVKYDTYIIKFCSAGVMQMLNPLNDSVGTDVFKFFKQNAIASNNNFKPRVRASLKNGHSISILVSLQTRRAAAFRGDERFATHWTPLKDEHGQIHYVVVSLAPRLQ